MGMRISEAERGYVQCMACDLNKPLGPQEGESEHASKKFFGPNSYDLVTCAGTFLDGHVGPSPALSELLHLVRPGGQLIFSVRSWSSNHATSSTSRGSSHCK